MAAFGPQPNDDAAEFWKAAHDAGEEYTESLRARIATLESKFATLLKQAQEAEYTVSQLYHWRDQYKEEAALVDRNCESASLSTRTGRPEPMTKLLRQGDTVVNVLTGSVGRVVERYHPNFNPHYADFRVRFIGDRYHVVRQRHLRRPMPAEHRLFARWNARFLAGLALADKTSPPLSPVARAGKEQP